MSEWYVLCEGSLRQPKLIIQGRKAACDALINGYRLTPAERANLGAFLEGPEPRMGATVLLVGYFLDNGKYMPDRSITRTEVA